MKLWRRRRGQEDDSCDALAPASLARSRKPDEESPIAAPLHQANVSGKDIPDADASLRKRLPHSPAGGNSPAIREKYRRKRTPYAGSFCSKI